MNVLDSLGFITRHPLTRHARRAALTRWFRWQLGSRLLPGPVIVPFVNDARLIVQPGMTGATGNIYCGLHEFDDMALVLHALRPDDLFVDVGANVGVYTVLAGAAAGARCISIEPVPATFAWLQQNIAINRFDARARPLNIGIGRANGTLRFTRGHDTTNHVVSDGEAAVDTIDVPVQTLDTVVDAEPAIIKIDVEGFETDVIAGAGHVLAARGLLAVIMELNGAGARYGYDEDALHQSMIERGFESCRYHPRDRKLVSLGGAQAAGGNTLYVRDIARLQERVRTAPTFRLGIGEEI